MERQPDRRRQVPAQQPRILVFAGRGGGVPSMRWLVDPLRRAGMDARTVDYSGDSGGGPPILQDIEDVALAASEAVGSTGAPPLLVGFSRGGAAVMNAVAAGAPHAAVVAIAAASDQAALMRGYRVHAPGSRHLLALQTRLNEPEDDPTLYERISPLRHPHSFSRPVLLVHGTNDMVIPIDHAWWMRDAIVEARGDVTLVEVEDAGHYFEKALRGYALHQVARHVVTWLTDFSRTAQA